MMRVEVEALDCTDAANRARSRSFVLHRGRRGNHKHKHNRTGKCTASTGISAIVAVFITGGPFFRQGAASTSPFTNEWDVQMALQNCFFGPGGHDFTYDYTTCVDSNQVPIADWDVSAVREMGYLFGGMLFGMPGSMEYFNADISRWDVSSATSMYGMFAYLKHFNRDLSNWNTASVTTMEEMFIDAQAFSGDLSNWNTASVTSMRALFLNAYSFNGDISNWNTASVTSMREMFYGAQSFNRDISRWNTASVTRMRHMFYNARDFNGDLSNWDTASVNDAFGMFSGATTWLNNHIWIDSNAHNYNDDGPPDRWCGSNCPFPADGNALRDAVYNCLSANPDGNCDCSQSWIDCKHGLSRPMREWDVSRVTDMSGLFGDGSSNNNYGYSLHSQNFNADISRWNTHSVTDMQYMFYGASNFNADISRWNTQSLHSMYGMFENAKSFNADITKWTCDAYEANRSRTNVENMFKGADAWHASYVSTHTGYFDLNLGPPNMWVPVDEYHEGDSASSSFASKDKRVQILIAFVAVLGAGLLGIVVFLIARCVTHRRRMVKNVTTQFRIAHAHAHAAGRQQQILGMSPMPLGSPVLPGRSPIVVTVPAPPVTSTSNVAATLQGKDPQQV